MHVRRRAPEEFVGHGGVAWAMTPKLREWDMDGWYPGQTRVKRRPTREGNAHRPNPFIVDYNRIGRARS